MCALLVVAFFLPHFGHRFCRILLGWFKPSLLLRSSVGLSFLLAALFFCRDGGGIMPPPSGKLLTRVVHSPPTSPSCNLFPEGSWDSAGKVYFLSNQTCPFISPAEANSCLSGLRVFFVGDSVSNQIAHAVASTLAGCSSEGADPACRRIASWPLFDLDSAYRELSATDLSHCPNKEICSGILQLNTSSISLRAFRYETLNGYKYKGIRPFFKELFLDTLLDNEIVIVNSGHHEIHFYMATEDLVAEVSKFVDDLVATPRWRSRASRATGSLIWRTMTPTEFPPRHRVSWM